MLLVALRACALCAGMLRAPSLNLDPAFTASLADIVAAHLRGQAPYNLPTTRQYPLRCPGCVNQDCADSKEYFVTQSPAAVTQSVTGCGPPPLPIAAPGCCNRSEEFGCSQERSGGGGGSGGAAETTTCRGGGVNVLHAMLSFNLSSFI